MVDILCTCLCINTYSLYVAVARADSQFFVFCCVCCVLVCLLACLCVVQSETYVNVKPIC